MALESATAAPTRRLTAVLLADVVGYSRSEEAVVDAAHRSDHRGGSLHVHRRSRRASSAGPKPGFIQRTPLLLLA